MKFGIFKNIGNSVKYGEITGLGLVKMNIKDFDSEHEAIDYINKYLPSNDYYYIFQFSIYTKPTSLE
jgi:hypothetical protein